MLTQHPQALAAPNDLLTRCDMLHERCQGLQRRADISLSLLREQMHHLEETLAFHSIRWSPLHPNTRAPFVHLRKF